MHRFVTCMLKLILWWILLVVSASIIGLMALGTIELIQVFFPRFLHDFRVNEAAVQAMVLIGAVGGLLVGTCYAFAQDWIY